MNPLDRHRREVLDPLWDRPGLSRRDRALVTLAHLVASGHAGALREFGPRALDLGVSRTEIGGVLTHLAFYAGWPVVAEAADVLAHLVEPSRTPTLPLDEEAEAVRAAGVEENFGEFFPGMVAATTDLLFRDLWLRTDLAPRDRSLVTVVALITNGGVPQIPFHLGRALDNGLTATETGELLHHLAYFTGWPAVFTAMPVVRDVLTNHSQN